jgi:hypothetical protein
MTYAAYLRIYEPVSAFHEPDRSRWVAYAASPTRPRRRDSLTAEHADALRRAIAAPQVVVPEQESEHAYVRRVDGITYVCPWQSRLRCLLAYGRMESPRAAPSPGAGPARDDERATEAPPRLEDAGLHGASARLQDAILRGPSARLHILASVWTVPLPWFVLFAATERWISLGPGPGRASAAATASATRALVYTTPMSRARQRVARGLATLRRLPAGSGDVGWEARAEDDLAEVARWLEEFHPSSLVELDYGGLVHLASDDALSGDQSVAEIRAAIDGVARGEYELAVAMYMRARSRWRSFAEFERAN